MTVSHNGTLTRLVNEGIMAQFPTGTYDLSLLQSCQPIKCVLRAVSPQVNSACNKPTQLHLVSRLLKSGATPPVPLCLRGTYKDSFTFTSTFMTHEWDQFGDKRATTRIAMLTDKLRQQKQQSRRSNFCITHGHF